MFVLEEFLRDLLPVQDDEGSASREQGEEKKKEQLGRRHDGSAARAALRTKKVRSAEKEC